MSTAKLVLIIELVLVGLGAAALSAAWLFTALECTSAICIYVGGTGDSLVGFLALLAWPVGVFGIGYGIRFYDRPMVWISAGVVALPLVFALYVTFLRTMAAG